MLIGELAAASGTTAKTVRFYEAIALLPPAVRTASGYRDFTPATLARLDFIRRGRAAGLTLAQIREVLQIRDAGRAPCQHVRGLLAERLAGLDAQIADLHDIRTTVSQLLDSAAAAAADPDTDDPGQVCRYL